MKFKHLYIVCVYLFLFFVLAVGQYSRSHAAVCSLGLRRVEAYTCVGDTIKYAGVWVLREGCVLGRQVATAGVPQMPGILSPHLPQGRAPAGPNGRSAVPLHLCLLQPSRQRAVLPT